MNSKLLDWNAFVPTEREEIGMVAELCGPNGTLNLVPSNFNNLDKRVVVVLKREDGTSTAITCSARVSEGVRAKDITISNLFGFIFDGLNLLFAIHYTTIYISINMSQNFVLVPKFFTWSFARDLLLTNASISHRILLLVAFRLI